MLTRALSCWCLVPALALGACGKVSSPHYDVVGMSGSAGATLTDGNTSVSAGSASLGGDPSSGGAASDGSGGSTADSGAGGAGPDEVLAALDTDDTTIDHLAGRELLELGLKVGYAEGYAQCTCLPSQPLDPKGLDVCARAESSFESLFDATRFRCILEESRTAAEFDDGLRCRIRRLRARGRGYQQCADGPGGRNLPTEPAAECESDVTDLVLSGNTCIDAVLCADDTFTLTGRCDHDVNCADGHDERGCWELSCSGKLVDVPQICEPEACPAPPESPYCPPGDPLHFLCGDGTEVSVRDLCNDVNDCANGRDEQYCFR